MSNSTHKCEVVKVSLTAHPNADKLSLVAVGGYQCVVKTEDWADQDLGVFIPPDNLVPLDHPSFAWLRGLGRTPHVVVIAGVGKEYHRVTAVKLRGQWSEGLLIHAPRDNAENYDYGVGTDLTDFYGIQHYNPPEQWVKGGRPVSGLKPKPRDRVPFVYDIDALKHNLEAFEEGEAVMVTEKIHGANLRCVFDGKTFKVASRQFWLRESEWHVKAALRRLLKPKFWLSRPLGETLRMLQDKSFWATFSSSAWFEGLRNTPEIEVFCRARPGYTVFGELYGPVQKGFHYGSPEKPRVLVFDIMAPGGKWLDVSDFNSMCHYWNLPQVPQIPVATKRFDSGAPFFLCGREWSSFDLPAILAAAEGKSTLADHLREGVVVRPLEERVKPGLGRVILKVVGRGYLEKEK